MLIYPIAEQQHPTAGQRGRVYVNYDGHQRLVILVMISGNISIRREPSTKITPRRLHCCKLLPTSSLSNTL